MRQDRQPTSDTAERTGHGDRVVTLRPRMGPRGGKTRRLSVIDPQRDPSWLGEQPADQMDLIEPGTEAEASDNRNRTLSNVIGVALIAILIGTGVWLAHAIADMRKLQDCVLSGRRNCAPIEAPASGR